VSEKLRNDAGNILCGLLGYVPDLVVCLTPVIIGNVWNWMPLAALGVIAGAFAIKMPIEASGVRTRSIKSFSRIIQEKIILDSKEIGDAYKAYKKGMPWRVFPYLW
jgi:hypothetical protein